MKKLTRILAALLAMLMLVSVLSACGGTGDQGGEEIVADGPKYGGHINVRITSHPTGVDPLKQTGAFKYLYMTAVYEPVLTRDADNQIAPSVCDFTLSEDQLDLKLWVRDGFTFSNGDTVDIYDVEASINRFLTLYANGKKYVKPYIGTMAVEQEDGKDILHIVFSSYHEKCLYYLAAYQTWCSVMPKEICEKYATTYIVTELQDAIGTGPYVFTEFEDSVSITISKREDYTPVESDRSGTAGTKYGYLDSMTFWYNSTDPSTAMALLAGDYDLAEVMPEDYEEEARSTGLTLEVLPSNQYTFVIFNTRGTGVCAQYPDLRKAVLAAIDYEEFLDVVCDGSQVMDNQFILDDKYETNAFVDADYYGEANPELAQQYLQKAKDAGYNGAPVQICYNSARTDVPTLLRDYMDKAGINCQVNTLEQAAASSFVADPSNPWDFTFQWQTVATRPSLLSDSILDNHYLNERKDELRELMATIDPDSQEYMDAWNELAQMTADGAYVGALARIDWWWWHPSTLHSNDEGYVRYLYNAYWDDPQNHTAD